LALAPDWLTGKDRTRSDKEVWSLHYKWTLNHYPPGLGKSLSFQKISKIAGFGQLGGSLTAMVLFVVTMAMLPALIAMRLQSYVIVFLTVSNSIINAGVLIV
jgi:hypothetical protein